MEMAKVDWTALSIIAKTEFADIVVSATRFDAKLRVVLIDNSFIDFWWSLISPQRFAHHWERRHLDGTIYRHDNAPHTQWSHLASFPRHFHSGSDQSVVASELSEIPEQAIREFLSFARKKLAELSTTP